MNDKKQILLWIAALILGGTLGFLGLPWLNDLANFVASVYTRLFQFLAVPAIALAITTTLASLGAQKESGRIFVHTISYTLLTTLAATLVALVLYVIIQPSNLPAEFVNAGAAAISGEGAMEVEKSVYDHITAIIPNNILRPFFEGHVLSILIVAAAAGLGISHLTTSKDEETKANAMHVFKFFQGMQDLLYLLIRALIWTLPVGIVAFAEQLTAAPMEGLGGALGKYVLVILGGNAVQFFVVLPLFLLARGLNPFKVLKGMMPAVLMALFTKSSAATLPVTIQSAEQNLNTNPKVSRFVLPICTTINMNGCAAFIFATSLFVMQNGGMIDFSGSLMDILPTLIMWVFIAVISAVGNAGVPMGCFFLTLSLMSGMGAPIAIMGIILPVFTIIDMIETAENVWSDSCVCAMTNRDLSE